jgi:hypothetical protein
MGLAEVKTWNENRSSALANGRPGMGQILITTELFLGTRP